MGKQNKLADKIAKKVTKKVTKKLSRKLSKAFFERLDLEKLMASRSFSSGTSDRPRDFP